MIIAIMIVVIVIMISSSRPNLPTKIIPTQIA